MGPKNQRRVSAEEAVEQCRRNRRQAAELESRNGPVLAEDALKKQTSVRDSKADKLIVK